MLSSGSEPTVWDGDLILATLIQPNCDSSEPTVWDGDHDKLELHLELLVLFRAHRVGWRHHKSFERQQKERVPSPPCGMETQRLGGFESVS